ncbi:MarR family winged helix-turn-helix transcriptional regulator [Streptomyces sp. NBRC 109706]|uniref:MarR family winged helix-turn-helix transcriptional regulator n=1 Tax=Streptomyces sp. NBRC 109706 TaxID=1550035 RepID=UPI0007862FD1|nr:MarR family transcriptional regulator [Streptomyces sp. NBRC 109706]
MDKPTRLIEFESMLFTRHTIPFNARKWGAERELDRSAYVLLSRIQIDGPLSISQLSQAFGLDVSTLNRQTAAMLRAGVVERIPDPEGGVARKFSITTEGERRLDADRARSIRSLERVMADWTPDEVAQFAGFLNRFNRDIERLEGRPWPRP